MFLLFLGEFGNFEEIEQNSEYLNGLKFIEDQVGFYIQLDIFNFSLCDSTGSMGGCEKYFLNSFFLLYSLKNAKDYETWNIIT